jgi:hypothetical protein
MPMDNIVQVFHRILDLKQAWVSTRAFFVILKHSNEEVVEKREFYTGLCATPRSRAEIAAFVNGAVQSFAQSAIAEDDAKWMKGLTA